MAYILVVDDDDIVAEHAARVLIDAGHACGWVSDAKAAMDLLRKRRPDVILLDHNMPGENGGSMLRRLRASPSLYDIPVIMLTGIQDVKQEQIAYYDGAQDYIRKPFSEKMLVYRIRQVLASREFHARLGRAQPTGFAKPGTPSMNAPRAV
ncbi:response regulator transcription factor [Aurantiacibacter luteus]|uniref:response regulator transcription factor n=1 Tax=Aurantiacibacter luteus TaxID=1581420 RepID=UPI00069C80E2|nr:response regulator [Aurantiacibacter luteus]